MEASLVALGGALLVAGLLARLGRRILLPAIPFFVLAGIALGPHTPGIALVDSADALGLLATFGLVMLLFHLGLEFSVRDLVAPIRDGFGAIFLFVFGVSIRPDLVLDVGAPILVGVLVSLVVNVAAGLVVARRSEMSRSAGLRVGLTVLARGEFSLILAALATAAGLDRRVHRGLRPGPLTARPRSLHPCRPIRTGGIA